MMPRKKKPKIDLKSILQSFLQQIHQKLESADIRETIYLISYIAAVKISYDAIEGITRVWSLTDFWYNALRVIGLPFFAITPTAPTEKGETININSLLMAFVTAYMVLKIDADDIVSATNAISSLFTKIKTV